MRIKNLKIDNTMSSNVTSLTDSQKSEEEISPSNSISAYSDRIVAFIDILGFRSIVQKSSQHHNSERYHIPQYREEGLSNAIFDALDTKQHAWQAAFFNELNITKEFQDELDLRITSFSDCIALSCSVNAINFCYLVFCINFIARHMHSKGFMLRGGICEGELHHTETYTDENDIVVPGRIFGPAFIQAYDLECKKASHSRIILSNMLWKRIKDNWLHDEQCKYCVYIEPFIEQDDDGPIKLDTLMFYYKHISEQGINSISSELKSIKSETEKVLGFYTEDSRIYSKLRKFSLEFNKMLDQLAHCSIPTDIIEPYKINQKLDRNERYTKLSKIAQEQ